MKKNNYPRSIKVSTKYGSIEIKQNKCDDFTLIFSDNEPDDIKFNTDINTLECLRDTIDNFIDFIGTFDTDCYPL